MLLLPLSSVTMHTGLLSVLMYFIFHGMKYKFLKNRVGEEAKEIGSWRCLDYRPIMRLEEKE